VPSVARTLGGVPELPEVESVRRQLAPELVGRTVVDVWWDPHPAQRFSDVGRLAGRRVTDVGRRGKFLVCPLEGSDDEPLELILHLGMTGSLSFAPTPAVTASTVRHRTASRTASDPGGDHVRAWFDLDDGRRLRFRDPRRFGRVSVVVAGDYAATVPTLALLGPEPLSPAFDAEAFAAGLAATTAPIKAVLLAQRLVAGVGNIYADEALWRARIHPRSRRVGRERAHRLHGTVRDVLAAAVEREGTTFRDYQMVNGESGRYADFLDVYGKAGLPCPRCGTTLRGDVVAQRGTTYCPRCQRA
jgi:formamidopyrimidine-DNA glycosylase